MQPITPEPFKNLIAFTIAQQIGFSPTTPFDTENPNDIALAEQIVDLVRKYTEDDMHELESELIFEMISHETFHDLTDDLLEIAFKRLGDTPNPPTTDLENRRPS